MLFKHIKKYILIFIGSIALALGVIGIFIPVLPTTPFLLLSAFCYIRSSRRLYAWLVNHKVLGRYIYNYLEHKAISRKARITALLFMWLGMSISIIIVSNIFIRLFLLIVGIGISIHLLKLKTLRDDH